jgi:hypothetical protein
MSQSEASRTETCLNPDSKVEEAFLGLSEALETDAHYLGAQIAHLAMTGKAEEAKRVVDIIGSIRKLKDWSDILWGMWNCFVSGGPIPDLPWDTTPVSAPVVAAIVVNNDVDAFVDPFEAADGDIEVVPTSTFRGQKNPDGRNGQQEVQDPARPAVTRVIRFREDYYHPVLECLSKMGAQSPISIRRYLLRHYPDLGLAVNDTAGLSFLAKLRNDMIRKNWIGGGNGVWAIRTEGHDWLKTNHP